MPRFGNRDTANFLRPKYLSMKHLPILILLIFFGKHTFAQDTISLKNASFEWSSAMANSIPSGWEICSRPNETPPDVHSKNTRHYKVKHDPKVGKNFIGLATLILNPPSVSSHDFNSVLVNE